MSLQDFVKETLLEVIRGIQYASAESKKSGAAINPSCELGMDIKTGRNVHMPKVQSVDFDVAVTTSSSEKTGKGGGLKIFEVVNFGSDKQSDMTEGTVSKIKFSVPIQFPSGNDTAP